MIFPSSRSRKVPPFARYSILRLVFTSNYRREADTMSDDKSPRPGDEKFVSLTTFKRNGDAIASPMWIVADGAQLSVWTHKFHDF